MRKLIFSLFRKINSALSGTGLWRFPGIALLWGLIYRAFSPKGIVLITCQGNRMYVNTELGYGDIGPILLIKGVYEEHETELFRELIKPGMVVLDIGANIGYYTLIASKLVGDDGRVYAFEPDPKNYELLVKNIEINGYNNITPIHKAVSNKSGRIKLFIDKLSPSLSSFSKDNVLEKAGFLEVETTALDDFFGLTGGDTVNLIKMDTQGAEGLIIEGSERLLRNNNLKIIMEFWPYGLRNVGTDPLGLLYKLQSYGFEIKPIDKTDRYTMDMGVKKIIEMCENRMNGKGHVNLLLEK